MKAISLNREVTAKAKEIIKKTFHPRPGFPSFYDASYHTLAILNDCDFITADRRHYEKTKEFGYIKLLESL